MNSIKLRELKANPQYQMLSIDLINEINDLFALSNIRTKKRTGKQSNNILKNNKFQINKNKIENRLILILNKVSNDNVKQLIIEYLATINIKDIDEYEIIQKEMYCKLIKDINFIDNYFIFMKNIFQINKSKLNIMPNYFIQILEYKIKHDYNNNDSNSIDLPDKFSFLHEFTTEQDRINNLKILKYFINNDFFYKSLDNDIGDIIIKQNRYIPDIYIWFNNTCIDNYYDLIKQHIKVCQSKNNLRNKILLESLINEKLEANTNIDCTFDNISYDEETDSTIDSTIDSNQDTFTIQVQNILDEYLYIRSIEEIIEFVKGECPTALDKNMFCKIVLIYYFNNTDTLPDDFINLLDTLIKKRILYKSNLSRGLINFTDNTNISNENKIKKLLLYLKSNNITKNIEHIFKKYNIKLYYSVK